MTTSPLSSAKSVIVIGAGVAGLVSARDLARAGFRVTVLDSAEAAGGCVSTHTVAGLRLDSGAESFATRGGTVAAYLAELGLGEAIVTPNPRGAWLQLDGDAAPLPKNSLLGIPGVPLAEDVRRILGWSGALRAQLDRYLPLVRVRKETDLGDIVRRRMGQKVLDRLVAPVVSGVHSAHPDLVDVHAVAPDLTATMTTQGSLAGAVLSIISRRGTRPAASGGRPDPAAAFDNALLASGARPHADSAPGKAAGSAVGGIDGGMYRLVEALLADCNRLGVDIQLGTSVQSIRRVPSATSSTPESSASGIATSQALRPAEWMVVLDDGTVLGSHGVVVAAGFRRALDLLAGVDSSVSVAEWPGSSSVTLATLVLDAPELDRAPRGTGVLVAEDVHTVAAKALTHATAKWSWLAREAGAGRHVVRLSYGRGARDNAGSGGSAPTVTLEQALADASILLDTPLAASQVRGFALTEWRDSLAFATVGHRARVDALVESLAEHPGLGVTGAWISGTGLAYVIDGARVKASQLAAGFASS